MEYSVLLLTTDKNSSAVILTAFTFDGCLASDLEVNRSNFQLDSVFSKRKIS